MRFVTLFFRNEIRDLKTFLSAYTPLFPDSLSTAAPQTIPNSGTILENLTRRVDRHCAKVL
jgi:hypothetical protein